jgi:hypothetical protein
MFVDEAILPRLKSRYVEWDAAIQAKKVPQRVEGKGGVEAEGVASASSKQLCLARCYVNPPASRAQMSWSLLTTPH